MKSEYIALNDPRVNLMSTHPGRIYTQDGPTTSERTPYPHTMQPDGRHQEPRMVSVNAPINTWNLAPGDFAELEVEDIPLIGIALELAEHHYDVDLYIDGEKIYGEFYCVSTYLPSSDGFGKIQWVMMDRGKHTVRLEVADKYNRMLDVTKTKPVHACVNGFVLMPEIVYPPPVYNTWMFTQDALPGDARNAKGSLQDNLIPAGNYLYLMDLYGQGTLETLTFRVDYPVVLEIIDGGVAQIEYQHDFPSWIRRVDLALQHSGALRTVLDVTQSGDALTVMMTKPVKFGSRLIIRLFNSDESDHTVEGLYMEGTLKCL